MSRCIDIPIRLDATVHTGARFADRGQHSVYETSYSLETSPGSYRWVRSEMRPQTDLMLSYASHSDFLHRLSDECHKLDADALVDHGIDHKDFSCHAMEVYVFWDQNECRAVEEVKPENWATIVAEMNRRLRYWDRSGTESVSFFVKWIYTPIGTLIEHSSLGL
jgi:hypothetical protein